MFILACCILHAITVCLRRLIAAFMVHVNNPTFPASEIFSGVLARIKLQKEDESAHCIKAVMWQLLHGSKRQETLCSMQDESQAQATPKVPHICSSHISCQRSCSAKHCPNAKRSKCLLIHRTPFPHSVLYGNLSVPDDWKVNKRKTSHFPGSTNSHNAHLWICTDLQLPLECPSISFEFNLTPQ